MWCPVGASEKDGGLGRLWGEVGEEDGRRARR